jgi:hypothetical protein
MLCCHNVVVGSRGSYVRLLALWDRTGKPILGMLKFLLPANLAERVNLREWRRT